MPSTDAAESGRAAASTSTRLKAKKARCMLAFNVGVELGQLAALALILIAFDVWRRSGTFLRGAFAANTVIMALGFVLFGYQVAGYATS